MTNPTPLSPWRPFLSLAIFMAVFSAVGCVEPPYRTEVTPNVQGGVELRHVPKEYTPPPPRPQTPAPAPAPAVALQSPPPADTGSMDEASRRQRIDQLEALVREMNAEIVRLKAQQPGSPTTAP